MEWTWNADAFDAIRITAAHGEFEIVGTDSNQITVESDGTPRRSNSQRPEIQDRWLFLPTYVSGDWTLELPKTKPWTIELTSGNGEVTIQNLHARLGVQIGSGEIHVENCRGIFHLRSGSGDVTLEECTQVEVPPAPPRTARPEPARDEAVPPPPPTPPGPLPFPPIGRSGRKFRMGLPGDWESLGGDWEQYGRDWEEWGERFAEKATRWAENFSLEFLGDLKLGWDDESRADGFHMRLGHGDIELTQVDAQLVTARLGSGDIRIEDGRIGTLDLKTNRGDVHVEAVLPTNAWELATRHGDLELQLTSDAYVRLDAATRHGEIQCDAPLVRVGRPGPGARHGGRMVGTVGEGQGEPMDIHLESMHGDINIDVDRRPSRYAGQATAPRKPERAAEAVSVVPATPTASAEPPAPASESAGRAGDVPSSAPPTPAPAEPRPQVYDSQMAILQALQKGEISVAEAEMLLRSLKAS